MSQRQAVQPQPQQPQQQQQGQTPAAGFAAYIAAVRACWRAWQLALYALLAAWLSAGVPSTVARGGADRNTMVVIGDDFAAGVGDTPNLGTSPGLARHLARELFKEPKIKQTWTIFNCGVKCSTSSEWLPVSEKNPSQPTTHFERTFANPKYAAASIVILLVGFNDSRVAGRDDAPEQTVANIHAICKVLANMGKLVFVCPVPNAGDASVSDELLEKNMRRNEMIAGFLQQSDRDLVVAGPNVDVLNFEYRVDRYYAADQQHFCAAGYAKLAKDFVDVLVNPMVRLEFKKFSKKLGL